MVGRGRPLLPEILGQPAALERNRRFSTDSRSYSASAVTSSEKVQYEVDCTLSNEPKMIIVRCP